MRINKFIILICLLCLGCDSYTRRIESSVLTESAVVVDNLYNPSYHQSSTDIGFTTGGEVTMTPTSIDVPETWGVIFRCQHGKFAITGSDVFHKKMWDRLDVNTEVTIKYKEVYDITYDSANDKEISRRLIDYDFIDAVPTTLERE